MIELTENLLYKLEEKMMLLMSEAESLRQQIQRMQQENAALKQESEGHVRKIHEFEQEKDSNNKRLQALVALLDSVNVPEAQAPVVSAPAYAAPVLVSG